METRDGDRRWQLRGSPFHPRSQPPPASPQASKERADMLSKGAVGVAVARAHAVQLSFDVWHCISCWMSVRDLCVVQSTCKTLKELLAVRCVWLSVLQDLLRVQPPLFPLDLPHMSPQELKNACLRIVRLNRAWSRKGSRPRLICEHKVASWCKEIRLLPGGKHALVFHHDGSVAILPTDPQTSLPGGKPISGAARQTAIDQVPSSLDVYPTSLNSALVVSRSAYSRSSVRERTGQDAELWHLDSNPFVGYEALCTTVCTVYFYDSITLDPVNSCSVVSGGLSRRTRTSYDGHTLWFICIESLKPSGWRLYLKSLGAGGGHYSRDEGCERVIDLDMPSEDIRTLELVSPNSLLIYTQSGSPPVGHYRLFALPSIPKLGQLHVQSAPKTRTPPAWVSEVSPGSHRTAGSFHRYRSRAGHIRASRTLFLDGSTAKLVDIPLANEDPEPARIQDLETSLPDLRPLTGPVYCRTWGSIHTHHSIGMFLSDTTTTVETPDGACHRIYTLVTHRTVSPYTTSFSPEAWRSHRLGNEAEDDKFPMAGFINITVDAQWEGCVESYSVDEVSGRVLFWLSQATGKELTPIVRVFETVTGTLAES